MAAKNHSNSDCLVVIFLTHGEIKLFDNDETCDTILNHDLMSHLHTSNGSLLPVHNVYGHFTDEQCPTLANKPKIFLIQACQDEKKSNELFNINEDEEIAKANLHPTLPQKDMLFAYSSMPGEKSFRTTGNGSWFIEALCDELNERGSVDDLTRILTHVSYRVAYDYVSYEFDIDQKKQMPCIVSRLTKLVYFPPKRSFLNSQNMKLSRCFFNISLSKNRNKTKFQEF